MFSEAANLSIVKLCNMILERTANYMDAYERIVQLMPADGYSAYYYDSGSQEKYMRVKILAWALTEKGKVVPLALTEGSGVGNPTNDLHCMGVYHSAEIDRPFLAAEIKIHEEIHDLLKNEESK